MDLNPLELYIKTNEKLLNIVVFKNFGVNLELQLKIGYYRCLVRIKSSKIKGIDINKRCCNYIYTRNVCKRHIKNNNELGLVNHYPNNRVMSFYKQYNITETINLNHKRFFSLNLKKKNTDIIKMAAPELNYAICETYEGSVDGMYNALINYNNLNKTHITLGEKKSIMSNIEKEKAKISNNIRKIKKSDKKHDTLRKTLKKTINKIDIYELNSIKIIDKYFNDCELYEIIFKNDIYLINKRKQIIGQLNYWIDDKDEIPREYKTADNKVLHPITRLPILEIEIDNIQSIYCDIISGTYREYIYDDNLESFKKTNSIIRCPT